jgi:carboxyl-terminal processing protease
METPGESVPPAPTFNERAIRIAAFVFLGVAVVTLAFGLGYMVKDLRGGSNSGGGNGTSASSSALTFDPAGASILDQIEQLLKSQYVGRDTLNVNSLRQAAISGIITSLNDRETSYLTPDEVQASHLTDGAQYQGIGATVSSQTGQIQIVAPFRDSPAEKAGILSGDIILEVDGQATDGWTSDYAVQQIRGVTGTKVTLKVKHLDGTVATITVIRGDIPIQSVFTQPQLNPIPGGDGKTLVDRTGAPATDIAYINISQFHENTVNELRTQAQGLEAKGYKGLILDLRSDPGGLLSATVDVADEFLSSGTILSEKDGNGQTQTWTAKSGGTLTHIPMVILMDAGSASGAEVLAAALRDNGRAKIIGVTSYGKGTVNQLMAINNCGDPKGCGALYMAVGHWLTPKGDQIEGLGIKPDIEVPMTQADYVGSGDIQLFKAIDVLRGQ